MLQQERALVEMSKELEKKKTEHQAALIEIAKTNAQLEVYNTRPKTQTVTKTRDTQYTEMIEKKVRKIITETPTPIENW